MAWWERRGRSRRLLQLVQSTGLGLIDGLDLAGGPADHGLVDTRVLSEAEVQPSLILRGESAAPRHFLELLMSVPVERHLRSDGAAIARGAFQLEFDPRIFRRDRIPVDEERAVLMGDHDVECAAIPQIREGHRTTVVGFRDA